MKTKIINAELFGQRQIDIEDTDISLSSFYDGDYTEIFIDGHWCSLDKSQLYQLYNVLCKLHDILEENRNE